jgi:hypothetical protein
MATLFKLNPLDSFSPASLPSLAPDADSHFRFQLSTDHEFRLPFIDEPQDGHAFVDPIFRALASLRLGKGEGRTRGRRRDAPEGLVEEVRVEGRYHVRGVADENSGYSVSARSIVRRDGELRCNSRTPNLASSPGI